MNTNSEPRTLLVTGETQQEARIVADLIAARDLVLADCDKFAPKRRATKIRYRVGSRYTYDPNRDAQFGIKGGRPDPNGPEASYWPNGALKGTRTVGDKIIRRIFRSVAMRNGRRIRREILDAQHVHAAARTVSTNSHEAKRVLAAEFAARRKARDDEKQRRMIGGAP